LADDDQTPGESDQASSQSDQAAADADQAAAATDQTAADADQAAADRDQAASDRDLVDGGDRGVHDASAESRDHSAAQRLRGGHERTRGVAVRDAGATARDQAAEARDQAAAECDREMDERDAERIPESSAADHGRVASARRRAAGDRERAAQDRQHAARYRLEAREERAALLDQIAVSETDALTGARARAPGLRDLEVEINRARHTTGRLAVAYVDLIGLKAVNDTQGHSAGDALLEAAVQLMQSHLRSYDVIIRIGGDEFVCVMSGAAVEDSRQRLAQIQAEAAASGLGLRFGIAALEPGDTPSDLIERADSELLSCDAPPIAPPVRVHPRPAPDNGCARILVTDDRPEMATVVSGALAERYTCDFAGSLDEAGEILADNAFDLLLCDLHSGGDAALSFARRTIEEGLDTAVILLAEDDDPAQAANAFEFGAFGYVVRPLPGQLLITVMNALRRRDLEIAHRRLSQSREERRQAIIDMVPIAIFAKDRSGHYVLANTKAEEMARMERGALLGKTDDAFLSPRHAESYTASDGRILAGAAVIEREDTIEYGGSPRTFKTTRFPLFDEAGAIVAVGGVAADVSVEREAIRVRDRSIEELEVSRQETVERLARAIDRHDASTGQHVNRLAALTSFLGTGLGLDPGRVALLSSAAPMHDVGKIGTPDEILRKPGPLSAEERSVMEQHALNGYEILSDSKSQLLRLAATIALTHHERFDGSGYPNGLVGEAIPIEGRITAVADVFDALLSDRAYRPAFSISEAVSLLAEGRGTQFDPDVLDLLLDHLDEALALREAAR
jgi:diguanylate cyclase (GGDEF)-like protein/PAS domain S-box-containing protein